MNIGVYVTVVGTVLVTVLTMLAGWFTRRADDAVIRASAYRAMVDQNIDRIKLARTDLEHSAAELKRLETMSSEYRSGIAACAQRRAGMGVPVYLGHAMARIAAPELWAEHDHRTEVAELALCDDNPNGPGFFRPGPRCTLPAGHGPLHEHHDDPTLAPTRRWYRLDDGTVIG